MTDLIERVARALCAGDGQAWENAADPLRSLGGDNEHEHYLSSAQDALAAAPAPGDAA